MSKRLGAHDPAWRNRQIELLLAEQIASCTVLTNLVSEACQRLSRLTFPLGFPARGYDLASAQALLADLTPVVTMDDWIAAADERFASGQAP